MNESPPPRGGEANPLELARRALQSADDDPNLRAWFSLSKGMALYRRGDFDAAAQTLQDALSPANVTRHSMAEMYLAMTYHQLGKADLARSAFDAGKQEMDANLPAATDGDLGGNGLENWLMCQTARREAQAMMSDQLPATRPRRAK